MGYGIIGINGKEMSIIAMGAIQLNKFESHYLRLKRIHERITGPVSYTHLTLPTICSV